MTHPSDTTTRLSGLLAPHGLGVHGLVVFHDAKTAPVLSTGAVARSVVLIGVAGGANWPAFLEWRKTDDGGPHPLDRWSKAVISPMAAMLGGEAWFPSDPPFMPFQQWAMAGGGLKPSPLGILIHPVYGLWHSYRGAIGFSQEAGEPEAHIVVDHPCERCAEKPCLSACPVRAVTDTGFDVATCRSHLKTVDGKADCMAQGCLARNACPVGTGYRYSKAQVQFHMAAFGP